MPYFTVTAQTKPDDLRRRYRALCKQHHPDRGGTAEIQAQVNIQYHQALKQLAELEQSNQPVYDSLMMQMERHLRNITMHMQQNKSLYQTFYKEIKSRIPVKYHRLLDEFVRLVVN